MNDFATESISTNEKLCTFSTPNKSIRCICIRKTYMYEKYIFGKFNRVIAFDNWCYTIFHFRWTGLSMDCHAIVFTSTRASNRRTKGENPLYDNMVPLNCAANTRRLLLRLRLSTAWESVGGWVRLRKRQRSAYRQTVGARKSVSRKAIGHPCRVSIGCHVSQYQQKKKHGTLICRCRSTSEWAKFKVR